MSSKGVQKIFKMGEWQQPLFGCFKNIGTCVISYFAPCYLAGKVAEANGENCLLYGLLSMLGCIGLWSRTKIRGMTRAAKGIDGDYTNDLLVVWFCGCCALAQEYNEHFPGASPLAQEEGLSMARE